MRVFISWSGEASRQFGEALKEWIPCVLQAAQPYFTPDDLEKGARWSNEIAKELDESDIGIICLTRDNLNKPWIMFESGAISKKLGGSSLCTVLFGVESSDVKGPLVQFQHTRFEKDDIRRLVSTINEACGDRKLTTSVLTSVFELWWPKLETKIKDIIENLPIKKEQARRSDRDILEEILERSRRMTRRDTMDSDLLQIHPEAIRDLALGYFKLIDGFVDCSREDAIPLLQELYKPIEYMITRSRDSNIDHEFARTLRDAVEKLKKIL